MTEDQCPRCGFSADVKTCMDRCKNCGQKLRDCSDLA
jgi:hypothetical protein